MIVITLMRHTYLVFRVLPFFRSSSIQTRYGQHIFSNNVQIMALDRTFCLSNEQKASCYFMSKVCSKSHRINLHSSSPHYFGKERRFQ